MIVRDWEGIANGEGISCADKAAARVGQDLPEDLERQLRDGIPAGMQFHVLRKAWGAGLMDIRAEGGVAMMGMTQRQSTAYKRARAIQSMLGDARG